MDCTPFGDFVARSREPFQVAEKQENDSPLPHERRSIFRPNDVLASVRQRYVAVARRAAAQETWAFLPHFAPAPESVDRS